MTDRADWMIFRIRNASTPDLVRERWQELVSCVVTLCVQEPHQGARPATMQEKQRCLDRAVRTVLENPVSPPEVVRIVEAFSWYQNVSPALHGFGFTRALMVARDAEQMEQFLVRVKGWSPDAFVTPLPLDVLQSYFWTALAGD